MKLPFLNTRVADREKNSTPEPTDPIALLQKYEFVFDSWYRAKYGIAEDLSCEAHYLLTGAAKGYDPNPLFKSRWYAEQHASVVATKLNPAIHYLAFGSQKGMRPNQYFDPVWYRNTYADIASSGMEPLVHYLKYGAREGRNPSATVSTQWLPQFLDPKTGELANPLCKFIEMLAQLKSDALPSNSENTNN